MGRMYFRHGAMGASKTAQALITQYNHQERGHNVLLIKPALDTRDGENKLSSRIGLSSPVTMVKPDDDIFAMYLAGVEKQLGKLYDVVIVDESQFLASHQVEELRRIVDFYDIPVFCYGLRTDFQSKLFEGSARLMELSDEIEEIKTVCSCGRKAVVNARLVDGMPVFEGDQVMIGGNESYVAMCHKCWYNAKMAARDRQQNITTEARRRFAIDMNLPIRDYESAVFYPTLEQLDNYFDTKAKWQLFYDSVKTRNWDSFITERTNVIQMMTNSIKFDTTRYQEFLHYTDSITPESYPNATRQFYNRDRIGQYFVSFDLAKGCFAALHHFNPEIVSNCNSYDEFIRRFTENEFLIQSKAVREAALGRLDNQCIAKYESMMIDTVAHLANLHRSECFNKNAVCAKNTDEVIYQVDESEIGYLIPVCRNIVNQAAESNIPLHCEIFQLIEVAPKTTGFIKKCFYGEKPYVIKCVPASEMVSAVNIVDHMPTDHFTHV